MKGHIILFGIFLLIGIGVSSWGADVLLKSTASGSWPTTEGRILSSEVKVRSSSRGTSYHAEILYQYYLDNTAYSGNTVSFGQYGSSDPNHAQQIVNKYPVGSTVSVYYDTNNPGVSVLEPGASWSSYFPLLLGLLFFCVGLGGILWTVKSRPKKEEPSAQFQSAQEFLPKSAEGLLIS